MRIVEIVTSNIIHAKTIPVVNVATSTDGWVD